MSGYCSFNFITRREYTKIPSTTIAITMFQIYLSENVDAVRLQTIAASRGSQGVLGGSATAAVWFFVVFQL